MTEEYDRKQRLIKTLEDLRQTYWNRLDELKKRSQSLDAREIALEKRVNDVLYLMSEKSFLEEEIDELEISLVKLLLQKNLEGEKL